jgi:fucose permease
MAAIAKPRDRAASTTALIAFASFIVLGLSFGLLGVAWPSMQVEFGLPLDAVAGLLLAQTIGYITSSALSARVIASLGSGRGLMAGLLLGAGGLFWAFLAPSWTLVIIAGFVGGLGNGVIDAGLNSYIATYYGSRSMNWLHACFGIGVTIGPAMMTLILAQGFSWRAGYGVVGVLALLIGALFLVTLRHWRDALPETGDLKPVQRAPMLSTLRLPLLWLSVALFVAYAGMEIGTGQWTKPLLMERGVDEFAAGYWVSVYWGCFTVGRILFGLLNVQGRVNLVLRLAMIGAMIGAVLLWLNFTPAVGFIGLGILGFAQAPLFALLILKTGERVGLAHAANTIGLQVSGAGIGVAILPGFAGWLAATYGLETISLFTVLMAVLVFVIHEVAMALRPKTDAPAPKPKREQVTADGTRLEVIEETEAGD